MRLSYCAQPTIVWAAAGLLALSLIVGCIGSSGSGGANSGKTTPGGTTSAPSGSGLASDAKRRYPLGTLSVVTVTIDGHAFRAWLAQEFDPRRPYVLEEGLMFVSSEEIADDQGMLFVFSDTGVRSFWMKNTIAPLDIAFAAADGRITKIWQMPPLTWDTFSSVEPVLFALEVKQGTFARLGIKEGDRMEIPQEAFNISP